MGLAAACDGDRGTATGGSVGDDSQRGLWRSNNAGGTWQRIWSRTPGPSSPGYVVADSTRPGRIYLSAGASGLLPTGRGRQRQRRRRHVGGFAPYAPGQPGPVAVATDGTVVLALAAATSGAGGGQPAQLLRSADGGTEWTDVADDTYRATSGYASGLAVDGNGGIYVSLIGGGVIRGTPVG